MFENFTPNGQIGMTAHAFLQQIDAFVSRSGEFNEFVRMYSPTRKWVIVSDYCIDDPNKPNNCLVFSLIPHVADITLLQEAISVVAPSDIKKSRSGNVNFVKFLNDFPVFNVGVLLDKKVRLSRDENEYFAAKFGALRKQLAFWKTSTPEGFGYYVNLEKKLLTLEKRLTSNGFNRKVLRHTEIVSNMAAYLAAYVTRSGAELVTWMSDRDKILSHMTSNGGPSLAIDFASTLHHVLCAQDDKKLGDLIFAEANEVGGLWYDPLVRIPDLICAALADFNLKTNRNSHVKFSPTANHVLTNLDRNIFFDLGILGDTPQVRCVRFEQLGRPDGSLATVEVDAPRVIAKIYADEEGDQGDIEVKNEPLSEPVS